MANARLGVARAARPTWGATALSLAATTGRASRRQGADGDEGRRGARNRRAEGHGPSRSAANGGPGATPRHPTARRSPTRSARISKVSSTPASTGPRGPHAARPKPSRLLTTFVNETPREAREMPEALLRLGELNWELERERSSSASRRGRRSPSTSAARPEPNFQPSRDLFARVLKDYPWFAVRSRALRRRLPRHRAGQTGRGARPLRSHPQGVSALALRPGRAHGARRGALQRQVRLRRRARRVRGGAQVQEQRSLRARDVQERVVHVAPRRSDEAAKRFVSVFEVTDTPGQGERRAAQAARRAPGRGAEVPRRGLHRGREEHRAGRLRLSHEDRRRRFAGKVVRALAVQFYDQAHYERGIEAYELLLKLEPTSARRRRLGPRNRAGLRRVED